MAEGKSLSPAPQDPRAEALPPQRERALPGMAPASFGSEGTVACLLGAAKGRQVPVRRIPHPAQELVLGCFNTPALARTEGSGFGPRAPQTMLWPTAPRTHL